MSRNPTTQAQKDEAYKEEYVFNSVAPYYGFVSNFGCLSNCFNQSQSDNGQYKQTAKANKERSSDNTPYLTSQRNSNVKFKDKALVIHLNTMDAKAIENLDGLNQSPETTDLIEGWRTS